MKCSHTFNLLDARGAISVTERAGLHRPRARTWRAQVAQAYYDSREALGFPMCSRQLKRGIDVRENDEMRTRPC